jgi:hypothetical protein
MKIHQKIADEFDYKNDLNLYAGEDKRKERIGEHIDQKILRDANRIEIYTQLIKRLKTKYYKCYLRDKRVETIDFDEYQAPITSKLFFCVPYHKKAIYFMPKRHRFGYLANEMPFYYEDIPTILIPQTVPYEDFQYLRNIEYMNVYTPQSSEEDNVRNSNVMANVSVDSLKTSFDAKVDLRGQFSTMCRGAYQYGFVDTFANTKYGQMISTIGGNTILLNNDLVQRDNEFPFKTIFRLKYSISNNIKKNKDTTYTLDLSNWFNHVIYEGFSAKGRQMAFHPDFKGLDVYRYSIRFDKDVQLLNGNTLEADYTNNLGVYRIKITQLQPNSIQVESYFLVNKDVVDAPNVRDVEDIYTAISKLNKGKLKFKLVKT